MKIDENSRDAIILFDFFTEESSKDLKVDFFCATVERYNADDGMKEWFIDMLSLVKWSDSDKEAIVKFLELHNVFLGDEL